ncbi:hypothetical protein HK104_002405 [Borealophlyctis nickersoniae]|nr:hypothetical protein HK104_002405 [Borealophlyctis nickersoniae]
MHRIDVAREAYEQCSFVFDERQDLVKQFNLPDNFQTWFALTVLHMWMLSTRLRAEGQGGKELRQEVFNHLWLDVEIKLGKAGVNKRVNQIVEDLLGAYYGHTLAYDEGLYENDAIFGAALWRNMYGAQNNVTPLQMEALLTYCRRQLQHIENMDRDDVLNGKFKFAEL